MLNTIKQIHVFIKQGVGLVFLPSTSITLKFIKKQEKQCLYEASNWLVLAIAYPQNIPRPESLQHISNENLDFFCKQDKQWTNIFSDPEPLETSNTDLPPSKQIDEDSKLAKITQTIKTYTNKSIPQTLPRKRQTSPPRHKRCQCHELCDGWRVDEPSRIAYLQSGSQGFSGFWVSKFTFVEAQTHWTACIWALATVWRPK